MGTLLQSRILLDARNRSKIIRALIGTNPLPPSWYAPTWATAGGVLINTPTLGAELLTDGGVENWTSPTNLTSWTESISGGSTVNQDTSIFHGGAASARMDIDASNNNAGILYALTIGVGQWLLISTFARTNAAGKMMNMRYGATIFSAPSLTNGSWSQHFAIGRTDLANNSIFLYRGQVISASFWLDDVSTKQITLASMFASINARLSNFNLVAPPISTLVTGTQAGIVLGLDAVTNPQNFVIAYCDGAGNVKTEKCVAGTYTILNTTAAAYGATKYFSAKKTGNTIYIYYGTTDFGTLITTQTVSDAGIVNNRRHGLFSTYSGNQFAGTFSIAPYS